MFLFHFQFLIIVLKTCFAANLCLRDARFEDATSTAARRLDCSDVDLCHLHHRIEGALGGSEIGISDRLRQGLLR